MASMQCYRSCSNNETYEAKHHEDSSFTHNHNKNQSLCYGQTTHHNKNNHHQQGGQYCASGQHLTNGTGAYGHNNHKLGQCGAGCNCNHGNNSHGHNNKACSSSGQSCGKSNNCEVQKMKMTVKNRSHSSRRRNKSYKDCDDGDRSGSDCSSGSDSD